VAASLADIGWRKPTNVVAVLCGLGIALVAVVLTRAWLPHYPHYPHPHLAEISAFKVTGVLAAAGVCAFAEEVVFRGWLMTELDRVGVPLPTQVVTSAVAFGLFHGFAVIPAALLGGAWAIVYLLGRRSLTPTFASHVLINLIIEPWFFLATVATQLH